MTSQDVLNYTLSAGIIVFITVLVFMAVFIVKAAQTVRKSTYVFFNITRDFLFLRGAAKLGVLNFIDSVLRRIGVGGDKRER